ncbi:MAG: hypothetical protein PHW63_02415 [Alphaproteobacteria bacterium]|nr:hypothetical protein [Alphaproteobacteria bacterium]
MMRRTFLIGLLGVGFCCLVGGCAMQRAADAQEAQQKMVGLSKEQVFSCMGIPVRKASEGDVEIWSYKSTNGWVEKTKKTTSATFSGSIESALSFGDETRERRFCTVQIVMKQDHVAAVHYNGPTGGFLTEDEQCAYAVRNCL